MYENLPIKHIVKLHNINQLGKVYGPAASTVVGVIVFLFCSEKPGILGDYAVIIGGFSGLAVYFLTFFICWLLLRSWQKQADVYLAAKNDGSGA